MAYLLRICSVFAHWKDIYPPKKDIYHPKKSDNINLANTLSGQSQISFADHSNPNVRATHPPPPRPLHRPGGGLPEPGGGAPRPAAPRPARPDDAAHRGGHHHHHPHRRPGLLCTLHCTQAASVATPAARKVYRVDGIKRRISAIGANPSTRIQGGRICSNRWTDLHQWWTELRQ